MAQINIVVRNLMSTAEAENRTQAYGADKWRVCERLNDMFASMAEGREAQYMSIQINHGNAGDASGTLTLTSVIAGDTAQVGDQIFTASASPVGPNQFLVGLSDSATAANLSAAINANPALVNVVSSSSASNVVTVDAANPGNAGNMIQLKGSVDVPPRLASAGNYGVLAASAITNTSASTAITGSIGVSPSGAITGFPPGTYSGSKDVNDSASAQAQADALAAYNSLAALGGATNLSGQDLGSVGTLGPGVYKFTSSAGLTGTLPLSGAGNPNALFVFQIGSTLTTASASSVTLSNSARAGNVYWQVGSSASLGSSSTLQGNILAYSSISMGTTSTLNGSAIALNGAVTMAGQSTVSTEAGSSGEDIVSSGLNLSGGSEPSPNSYIFGGNI